MSLFRQRCAAVGSVIIAICLSCCSAITLYGKQHKVTLSAVQRTSDKKFVSSIPNCSGCFFKRRVIINSHKPFSRQLKYKKTVYAIQGDITLDSDVTVPYGSIMKFEGGSLNGNGHTLTGNGTTIEAPIVPIISNVEIAGTWGEQDFYAEWFGAAGDGITDDGPAMSLALSLGNLHLLDKTYYINKTLKITSSNRRIHGGDSTLIKISSYGKKNPIILCRDISGVIIENLSLTVDGFEWRERTDNPQEDGYAEYFALRKAQVRGGLVCEYCNDFIIRNLTISYSGYGILCNMGNSHFTVKDNYIHHTMIDGIAMYTQDKHFLVEGNRIEYTCDDAISVVSTHDDNLSGECSDILVENNSIYNCYARPFIINGGENITFRNNTVSGCGLSLIYISDKTGNPKVDPLSRPHEINISDNYFEFTYPNVPVNQNNRVLIINNCDDLFFSKNVIKYKKPNEVSLANGNYIQVYNCTNSTFEGNTIDFAGFIVLGQDTRNIAFLHNVLRKSLMNAIRLENGSNIDVTENQMDKYPHEVSKRVFTVLGDVYDATVMDNHITSGDIYVSEKAKRIKSNLSGITNHNLNPNDNPNFEH